MGRHDDRREIRVLSVGALAIGTDEEMGDHRGRIVKHEFGSKPSHGYATIGTAWIVQVPQGIL